MEQETFYQEDNMNKLTIAKDLTTNAPVVLDLPSITLAVGDKLSGKTFLIRKLIEKKEDGRILLRPWLPQQRTYVPEIRR